MSLGRDSLGRKFFARLEPYGLARRNGHFGARARVSTHAALARLYHEHPKASKLNSFTFCEGFFHRIEERIDNLFGLLLWNTGLVCHLVDDVQFDHHFLLSLKPPGKKTKTRCLSMIFP